MSTEKLKSLQSGGWKTGSARGFLQLSDEEAMAVELKLSLADAVRQSRQKRGLSQIDLAQRMGSSQSRVAKIEAGDPSVSLDLIVRVLCVWWYPAGITARGWGETEDGGLRQLLH